MRTAVTVLVAFAFATPSAAALYGYAASGGRWTAEERETLRSLSLASLDPLPADPSNRYSDDTLAARLGRQLFFDTRLSSNGKVSCASCHVPSQDLQDGIPLGKGVGTAGRRTMPIAGTAYSPWQFWDGRADSQWAQALGPLESAVEHGGDRTQYAHVVATDPTYRSGYERTFGRIPVLDGLPAYAGPVADTVRAAAWRDSGHAAGRHHARLRESRQGHRGVRAAHRLRALALRPLRGARARRPRARLDERVYPRRGGGAPAFHRQGELRHLPQRRALHRQPLPQHGRGHRIRLAPRGQWPQRRRPAGRCGRVRMHEPLERLQGRRMRGAGVRGHRGRGAGPRLQDAVAP